MIKLQIFKNNLPIQKLLLKIWTKNIFQKFLTSVKTKVFLKMTPTKGLKSNRTKDAIKYLPSAVEKIQNPPLSLPIIENIENYYEDVSDDLHGEGMRFIIP